jgi:hypothetical protein
MLANSMREPRRSFVASRVGLVVNALYFHTVELLLKAFLRAHNEEVWGHEIGKLYERCRSLGLKVKSDDRFNLGNVVSLLESGNEDMAFRYFSWDSRTEPDLAWTRDVVATLMEVVGKVVEPNGPAVVPGPAVKMNIVIGKPRPKSELPKKIAS